MKTKIFISILLVVFLCSFQSFAGKTVAKHTVSANVSSYNIDAKGNIVELTVERTNGVISKVTFVAKNKKGKEYASGEIAEAIGKNSISAAGLIKKVLILDVDGTIFSYKISKKGAVKIGELTPASGQYLNIFGNKLVLETHSGDNYKFEEYGYDLKPKKKFVEGTGNWPRTLDYKKGIVGFEKNETTGDTTVEIVSP